MHTPSFLLSLDVGPDRSTPDDVADALEAHAKFLRELPGGPFGGAGYDLVGKVFDIDGEHRGIWAVSEYQRFSEEGQRRVTRLAEHLFEMAHPGRKWAVDADQDEQLNYYSDALDVVAIMPHLLPLEDTDLNGANA